MKHKQYQKVFWSLLYLIISYLFQRKEKEQQKNISKTFAANFHPDYILAFYIHALFPSETSD